MRHSITLTLAAAALILSGCCRHSEFLKADYMNHVSQFYDCSFVDWDSFTDVNQYSSDWGQEADALIHESWKGHNAASVYWDRLQNAKAYLHRHSLPLRAVSNSRVRRDLDRLEEGFDKAFIDMVSQDYYMRVFEDVFDETVPARIDSLVEILSKHR
jgi:hypothetical protein